MYINDFFARLLIVPFAETYNLSFPNNKTDRNNRFLGLLRQKRVKRAQRAISENKNNPCTVNEQLKPKDCRNKFKTVSINPDGKHNHIHIGIRTSWHNFRSLYRFMFSY